MSNPREVLPKHDLHNLAAPGANTSFASFTPSRPGSIARIHVVLATVSVLNYVVTDGTTSYTVGLNNSVALAAGDGYMFDFACPKQSSGGANGSATLTYSFQVETNGVIQRLVVDEISTGDA